MRLPKHLHSRIQTKHLRVFPGIHKIHCYTSNTGCIWKRRQEVKEVEDIRKDGKHKVEMNVEFFLFGPSWDHGTHLYS